MTIDLKERLARLSELVNRVTAPPGWEAFQVVPGDIPWWQITEQEGRGRAHERQRLQKWGRLHPGYFVEAQRRYVGMHPERIVKTYERYEKEHPGRRAEADRDYYHRKKIGVINILGGKCIKCGEADWRMLQVNHVVGNGKVDREKYKKPISFYRAILDKTRSTEGLNLLCGNCNILHEFELGRRAIMTHRIKLHSAAIEILGGKCARCGNDDLRVLQVNHLNGGGRKERGDNCGQLYKSIVNGERATDDLNVLCANCNMIFEYESGRRDSHEDEGRRECYLN